MDPGSTDSEVEVFYRTESVNDVGSPILTGKVCQGMFWAAVTYVTKSLVYSGNEKARPSGIWAVPIVRFKFQLDFEFDYRFVEFHFDNHIYIPRDPGIRIGGPRGMYIVYNCPRAIPGEGMTS